MLRWWMLGILLDPSLQLPAAEKLPQTIIFEIAVPAESEIAKPVVKAFKYILKNQGIAFNTINFPTRRGLEELKSGRVDGSLGRISDLNKFTGTMNFVRIDYPVVSITASLWCNRNVGQQSRKLRMANRLGILLGNTLASLLDPDQVYIEDVNSYSSILQMLKSGRIDCFLSNDAILESEKISLRDLNPFVRHDLLTSRVYPWISVRYKHLKPIIEEGLRTYPFPPEWRKKFQDVTAVCNNEFDLLCPDGILYKEQIDLKKLGTWQRSANVPKN